MKKNDVRIIKTKENVHEALLELLKTKSLPKIKVTELCKTAGISRGTFYLHYQEVADVFDELFQDTMLDLERSYIVPFKKGFTLSQKNLEPDMISIFQHVKKHEPFYRIILSENVFIKYYYLLYEAIMKLHQDVRYADAEQDRYSTAYFSNGFIALIIEWYKNDFRDSIEEMNDRLFKIILSNHLK